MSWRPLSQYTDDRRRGRARPGVRGARVLNCEVIHKVWYTCTVVTSAASRTMPPEDPHRFLSRSVKALQDTVGRAGPAATASYTLIGAILVLGGIGYALDAWR